LDKEFQAKAITMESPLEKLLISAHKPVIMQFLDKHPESFKEAMQLALSDKHPYSWRAAWMMWGYIKKNDSRIKPYLPKIIAALEIRPEGQQRELLKILYLMDIKEDHEGKLFDHCVKIWFALKKKPAVRMNALKVLIKIAERHPELKDEVKLLTRKEYLESLSPGVKHSINKLIHEKL
jgi:hypothetical protein